MNDPTRHVELDVDIGADAKDWSAIQATEKLKPVEADLRRMEEMVAEIVTEMDYLRTREQKLRDTNESTNNRVKWFGFGTTFLLIGLWVWQVLYLRAYFRLVVSRVYYILQRIQVDADPHFLSQIQAPYLKMGTSVFSRTRWHGDMVTYEYPEFRTGWAFGARVEHGLGTFSDICVHLGRQKAFNDDSYERFDVRICTPVEVVASSLRPRETVSKVSKCYTSPQPREMTSDCASEHSETLLTHSLPY